jgi:UPF0271 protein
VSEARVDLNVDLGELEGEDEELYSLATVVNVACGGHAGDERSMRASVRAAIRGGAGLAAHPSYADRAGFGRRAGFSPPRDVRRDVASQVGALLAIARDEAAPLRALKLHGALYHDASTHPAIAQAALDAALDVLGGALLVVGPPRGALRDACAAASIAYAREGFADRGYDADGSLLARDRLGALLGSADEAAAQALALVRRGGIETICIHGDTPGAVAIARGVRAALLEAGCLRVAG